MDIVSPLLTLVPFLFQKLEKEFEVPADAVKKFQSLKESIGVIERFLKKANSMEVITEDVKASVKRARKFLYVLEDALDDFRGDGNQSMREGGPKKEFMWEGFIFDLYRHYKRRTFVHEARHILLMVDDYMTLEKDAIGDALRGLSGNDAQSSSAGNLSSSISYSEERDEVLVGIRQSKEELVKLLKRDAGQPKVIFVHGAPGVGKTSLVGAVLRDQGVEHLFKYYVWIEDLRSCELSAAALMEANTKMWDLSLAEKENPRDHKLKEVFPLMEKDVPKGKSWALVMDDASRVDVFKSLQSHINRTLPTVLVTTRIRSLQSSSTRFFKSLKAQYVSHELERVLLTKEESRDLFRKNIHGEVSDCILEKCYGLPLEILATCDLLNCQRPSATGAPDCVKWKKLSGRLGEALLSNGYEGGPIRRMRAPRMDPLLDVRACRLYLSIFPINCPIRCSTVMRLWMAEGFIKQEGAQSVQEKAEETLEKLLDQYEILEKEKTSYGRVKICGVPLGRHQQISESIDEELVTIVDRQERGWPENIWHLSFHRDMDGTYDEAWVQQLRSLIVFKKVHPRSLRNLLGKAKRLKVLDLQSHMIEEEKNNQALNAFRPEIFELKYLRYLSLRGSRINNISEQINKLIYLETLDLRDTFVHALPKKLKLKALRHLLVSNRKSVESVQQRCKIIRIWRRCIESPRSMVAYTNLKLGVKAPSQLRDLTSLQKLCMIEVETDRREEWLKELGELTNLQKLGLSMLKSTDWEPLWSSIGKLTNLEALHLIGAEKEIIERPQRAEWKAPEYLQRVHLTGRLETLPAWILPRDSLVKLVLKGSQMEEDPLSQLGELPCLKHLEMEQAFHNTEMEFDGGMFEKLRFLGLDNFCKLKSIEVTEEALPSLESLYLARCKELTTVPDFIEQRLRRFKNLEFCEMHEAFGELVDKVNNVKENSELMVADSRTWIGPTREVEDVRGKGSPMLAEDFNK
ncbi:hypothetical protein BT93_L4571 [Corymbia citriodora subsp. variegata]|uniref:Uncharacterized protein n=1 Tax=Corymbia citriodora subsp. variegata TaxID=360336 RepID=A0A8T0CXE6_CORYI|nr:hypothetical protein BT93_L4571 [Corymbia citriodora subsp. variegata]